ncbi:hypothetical protein N480_01340 [Pseudoalteromonas luteoviolacea S2607]|uniref:PfkB family carbohydrate kinase n=1 Tax=Pseudoalteromonas luteoviolacea TaxID=43657 RepID=UPI0007B0887F|nr:PfkB family carbohydrate kinase [Pseudoalteromonas luteoviolacea]KZN39507.1 hypothetical protein N480_01340 [Pseudoalteromonas luteoviolacea S2607]
MQTILVTGKFDILHPGHVRLLKFAKECGAHLTVAVMSDEVMSQSCSVNEQHRLELIQSLGSVDSAFISNENAVELIHRLKPDAVIKGKEFEERDNPEKAALDTYGGRLIFGSGEFDISTQHYMSLKRNLQLGKSFDFSKTKDYVKRHNISSTSITDLFKKINNLKVCVIGEVIVDQYVQGTAIGMSQEDPTIVITPNTTDTFLGGAAITAGHIKAMGAAEVTFLSVLGKDDYANYVKSNIDEYNLSCHFYTDPSRPTPLKTRYRAGNKTLLRVNQCRQHKISKEVQNDLYNQFETIVKDLDILVFSDFNYGLLPQDLVNRLCTLCEKNNVTMVADSQTSSQVGDISRYSNMHLLTPTEKEVRVALGNVDDGLPILAQKLCQKATPKFLVITLANEGIFIHIPTSDNLWENDMLPAINRKAVDPAGAGDCFLAASALALGAEATPWQAFFLGSIAAACQVDTLGNKPLEAQALIHTINEHFNT